MPVASSHVLCSGGISDAHGLTAREAHPLPLPTSRGIYLRPSLTCAPASAAESRSTQIAQFCHANGPTSPADGNRPYRRLLALAGAG